MDGCFLSLIEWGVADEALPGERESGDRYLVQPMPSGVLVAVVDGIGHGEDAARTAELAISALKSSSGASLITRLRCSQEKLRGTRGAVLSMSFFNSGDGTMTWLGVGNVEGVLLRSEAPVIPRQESLLLRAGVVGTPLPAISASIIPVSYGDLLIFATDGIRSGFADNLNTNASTQEIAQCIMERHWRKTDDALVLVARYVYKAEPKPRG